MDTLDECLLFTLQEEGGFVDDPRDPGGATNMGITLSTLRVWRDDPHLGVADVKALTRDMATSIYGADYWNRQRCDALPPGLDLMVFDFAVTAGALRSTKMLQSALGFADKTVDGSVGPDTIRCALACVRGDVVTQLADRHTAYYRGLPAFHVFGVGWLARTARRKATALRMVDARPATVAS